MKSLMPLFFAVTISLPPLMSSDAAEQPSEWPQWRGPDRNGHSPGRAWPEKLGEDQLKQVWRVELGPSYSGPIVARDRIFVTETKDKADEVVYALDRATGKEIWRASWKGALTVPFFARSNGSWIRSTPAFDGKHLFVAGMRDVLVCLNAENGKEQWRVDFAERYKSPLPAFGFVSSPLVDGEDLYVQAGASVIKLDKKTGKTLWRSLEDGGGMWGSAFSSPTFATLAGKRQLLVQTREILAGLDPENGKPLWQKNIEAYRGMNILTPTVFGDSVFTSAYGGQSLRFDLKKKESAIEATEGWKLKLQGYMSTPVVIGDHAYLHLRNQRVTCVDLKKGEVCWTTDKTFGKYWSMVVRKERILALDDRGILYLFNANPEKFDLLDTRKISKDESWAHVATADDELFVREQNAITAYRWK